MSHFWIWAAVLVTVCTIILMFCLIEDEQRDLGIDDDHTNG